MAASAKCSTVKRKFKPRQLKTPLEYIPLVDAFSWAAQIADFDYMHANLDWGVLTYTFHPYCIGRGHRMMALEKLMSHVQAKGAAFMTMIEVVEEFELREPYVANGKAP